MAIDIQDPRITRTLRTGYPEPVNDKPFGDDFFGNEIMPGDEYLEWEDDIFRKDDISFDLQQFLLHLGAKEKTAE
jgi:hypothetical protein